ncbi:hypothetical protein [Helicobacter sp. UBA3407]|nr:hypothetical protein [Helicobacter sp. UBA3407]
MLQILPQSLRGEAEASVAKATDPHLQIHNIESRIESHKDNAIIKR